MEISTELVNACADYDYIRFTYCDLHGVARSKVVPTDDIIRHLNDGVSCVVIGLCLGVRGEMFPEKAFHRYGPRVTVRTGCNMYLRPAVPAVYSLPWAGGRYRVGEVLCECAWDGGELQEAGPRVVARRQLDRLSQLGYSLYSAYEAEFLVVHQEDITKPMFEGHDFMSNVVFGEIEPFVYELIDNLKQSDVKIENVHTEMGPGQIELTGVPTFDIEAGDMQFRMKSIVKEFSKTKGYSATFMSKPFDDKIMETKNGLHFNHSLWTFPDKSTGTSERINAFHQPDGEHKMSSVGRHWIAGLIKHAPALAAICCPTVNCYRRLHGFATPTVGDWGYQDRMAAFRVQAVSPSATFVESRLPSGSSNPYLVMAATVAAGIDGLRNQLECPPMADDSAASLPATLEEAVEAVKADQVITSALGEDFMLWFAALKEVLEIEYFKSHLMKEYIKEQMEAERKEYFKLL